MVLSSSKEPQLQSLYTINNYHNYSSQESSSKIRPAFITLFILVTLLVICSIYDWAISEKSLDNSNNLSNIPKSNISIIIGAFLLPIAGLTINCYIIPFLIVQRPPEVLDIIFLGFAFILHVILSVYIHSIFLNLYDKVATAIIIGSIVAILFFLSTTIPKTHPIILLFLEIFINFMGIYIISIYTKKSLLDNDLLGKNYSIKVLLFTLIIGAQTLTAQPLREYIATLENNINSNISN